MKLKTATVLIVLGVVGGVVCDGFAQGERERSLYDLPPRWLVDMPTAGTLPRAVWTIGVRWYTEGGALAAADIGLSSRFMLGIAYGGEGIFSAREPEWHPRLEFSLKFRVVDEYEYFPAISVGFTSQGYGGWNEDLKRYAFKSRGFYAVVSRSVYVYEWTAGWHGGLNYTLESDEDGETDVDFFLGVDATFKYNLGLLLEWDAALNDDRSRLPDGTPYTFAGKGRGYLSASLKWLFTEHLEMEVLLKDLLVNRRGEDITFSREIRLTYIDRF